VFGFGCIEAPAIRPALRSLAHALSREARSGG